MLLHDAILCGGVFAITVVNYANNSTSIRNVVDKVLLQTVIMMCVIGVHD